MDNAQAKVSFDLKFECSTNNPATSEGQPPASVPFPRKRSEDEDCVTIGSKEKSEAAKSNLKVVANLEDRVREVIEVDRRHQNVFFHNRAKLIGQISRGHGGVDITFPPAGSDSSKVWLNGAKNHVNTAKRAIIEIVADQEAGVVIECNIPRKHHSEVLGPKRANVRAFPMNMVYPS